MGATAPELTVAAAATSTRSQALGHQSSARPGSALALPAPPSPSQLAPPGSALPGFMTPPTGPAPTLANA